MLFIFYPNAFFSGILYSDQWRSLREAACKPFLAVGFNFKTMALNNKIKD